MANYYFTNSTVGAAPNLYLSPNYPPTCSDDRLPLLPSTDGKVSIIYVQRFHDMNEELDEALKGNRGDKCLIECRPNRKKIITEMCKGYDSEAERYILYICPAITSNFPFNSLVPLNILWRHEFKLCHIQTRP